jgi:hypothetical protein
MSCSVEPGELQFEQIRFAGARRALHGRLHPPAAIRREEAGHIGGVLGAVIRRKAEYAIDLA